MTGRSASQDHVYRHELSTEGERRILHPLVTTGLRALDIGTAATGRTALLLRDLGADVVSIDYNPAALDEFRRTARASELTISAADAGALPFADAAFGLVLFALHGSDYIVDPAHRERMFSEIDRVLEPGGVAIIHALNRRGLIFTPSGLRHWGMVKMRTKHILLGRPVQRTMVDVNGLELHQASPAYILNEVTTASSLRFERATDLEGRPRSLRRITWFVPEPYYLFGKP